MSLLFPSVHSEPDNGEIAAHRAHTQRSTDTLSPLQMSIRTLGNATRIRATPREQAYPACTPLVSEDLRKRLIHFLRLSPFVQKNITSHDGIVNLRTSASICQATNSVTRDMAPIDPASPAAHRIHSRERCHSAAKPSGNRPFPYRPGQDCYTRGRRRAAPRSLYCIP